jgi:Domain of unknown function (DUF4157)
MFAAKISRSPLKSDKPSDRRFGQLGLAPSKQLSPLVADEPTRNPRLAAGGPILPGSSSPLAAPLLKLSPLRPNLIRRKLEVGALNDPLEADADRVADEVLGMPHPGNSAGSHPSCAVGQCDCANCSAKHHENGRLTRKAPSGTPGLATTSAPPLVQRVLSQPGKPLDHSARTFFEPRFGYDFSSVRIHSGDEAAESASSIGALAFTSGHHIVFGRDQYSPTSSAGSRLLAHELAHVTQDCGTIRRQPEPHLNAQVACVVRLGGCIQTRDAGIPSPDDITRYNTECRGKSQYTGADITPTDQECSNPPKEELSTGEKILLGAFIFLGAAAAAAVIIVAGEVIIPIVVSSVVEAGTTAWVFYLANAIAVNEIGVFAIGLVLACEGNIVGLAKAMVDDPAQAAVLLAQIYILHVQISIANGPPRNATVPAKLLPPDEQTEPNTIKFKTAGAPQFEDNEGTAGPSPSTAGTTTAPRPSTQNPAVAADQAEFDSLEQRIQNYRSNPKTPGRIDVPATPRVPGDPKAPNTPVQGGTVAVAKTNVTGLGQKYYGGASPQALPPGYKGQPGTSGGQVLTPANPLSTDHAEQVALNSLHGDLSALLKDATPAQRAALLQGKTVWVLVEQEPCSSCASGVGTQASPGVLKQFSDLYPELKIEIRNLRTSSRIVLGGGSATVKKP